MLVLRSAAPSPYGRKVKICAALLGLSDQIKIVEMMLYPGYTHRVGGPKIAATRNGSIIRPARSSGRWPLWRLTRRS